MSFFYRGEPVVREYRALHCAYPVRSFLRHMDGFTEHIFRRLPDPLRKGRMGMDRFGNILGREARLHCHRNLMDKVRCMGANNVRTDYFACMCIGDNLKETGYLSCRMGLPKCTDREVTGLYAHPLPYRLMLPQSYRCNLRRGEYCGRH